MTEAQLLKAVKASLGITGDYQNDTLQVYIDEVKQYMLDAGVDAVVVESRFATGAIARGVADLWSYSAGDLSSYFKERVTQLAFTVGDDEDV